MRVENEAAMCEALCDCSFSNVIKDINCELRSRKCQVMGTLNIIYSVVATASIRRIFYDALSSQVQQRPVDPFGDWSDSYLWRRIPVFDRRVNYYGTRSNAEYIGLLETHTMSVDRFDLHV